MANKKINELIEKAVVNANDLVFVGDPVTGWLYNTTIADLQVGSITGGLAGSGQTGYIPRFKTGQTLENSLLFNGASGIGIGTTSGSHYLSLNGDYARTIGLERSTIPNASGGLGLTLLAGGSASGMLNSSGGDLILKSGISTGNGLSSIRLFTSTSGVSGTQDNALIEQVTVLGNGNTGFGVINPTYKVEVDGSIGNGEYGIDTSFISFNNAPISVPTTPGTLRWNDTDGTLEFTMKGGNVTQQIGQELPILVKHADNTGLIEGKVVYSVGTDGGNLTVRYANSNMETTSSTTFGVMTESATGGAKAFCTTFGLVRNFDTSALAEGQAIWLDSVDGGMTTTKPVQPKHLVYIGVCLRSHATNGVIFVNVSNGQELEELHDVLITNRQNNQTLIYDSATSLWKNRTIIGTNGYIPYWDSTDLFKQSPILVSASGTTVTMNGMNLLLNDSGTLNYLTKFGSTKTVIDSLIYDSGTKIGIGTTNPEFLFTVVGGAMGVYSSSTNYGFIDTANTSMRLVSANGFNFTANNIGTIANTRVDANGNWGFGIGTPAYKVDVNGDVNTNGIYRINGSPLSTSNIAEGTNLYFTSNRVLGQVLTGLNTSLNGVVTAADSLIVGISKLQNQVSSIVSGVSSVFGRTGAVTAQSGDYTTTLVTEGTNLYYTQARFDSAFGAKSTTNLTEGTNLYFTNARARLALSAGTGISYNNTTGVISYNGTVYTDSSIRALFSAGSGISYNSTTGVIASTITQYTDAMARASLSFVAGSGGYNSTTGVITIPTNTNQLTNGAGYITGITSGMVTTALGYTPVPTTRTITINGTTQDLSTDRTFTVAGTISGLTTNYIPKATSATTIGNSLIFDNGTSVGISETTPTEGRLVINNSSGSTNNGVSGNTLYLKAQTANANLIRFSGAIATDLIFGRFGNYDGLSIGTTGGTEIIRFLSSGNVGIGTSSPSAKLTIQGLTSDQIRVYEVTDSSNYYKIGRNSTTGYLDFYGNQSGYIGYLFGGADGTRMTLNSSGNLGLGVTPSAWGSTSYKAIQGNYGTSFTFDQNVPTAHIVSNAYNNGTNWIYQINAPASRYAVNGWTGEHIWFNAPSGTAGNAISFTQAMTLDASGRLGLGITNPTYKFEISDGTRTGVFNPNSVSDFFFIGVKEAKPLALGTQDTERVRINATTGNVSIGNTNNTYKLDVSGTGYFSGSLTVGSLLRVIEGGYNRFFEVSESSIKLYGGGDPSIKFGDYNTGVDKTATIGFEDNYFGRGSLSFRVKGQANGTGITALSIASTGSATFSSSVTASGIINGTTSQFTAGGTAINTIYASGPSTFGVSSSDAIYLRRYGVGEYQFQTISGGASGGNLSLQSYGGNVGIGTTNIGFQTANRTVVSINGTSTALMEFQTGGVFKSYFYQSGNGFEIYDNTSIAFSTNGAERARLASNGNFGIGTTSPGYKLEVSGTVANLNNLIYSGGSLFLRNPANTFDWALYQDSSNNLKVDFNGTNRLLITSGGSATFSSSITTTSTINSGSGVNNVTLNAGNLDFYNAGASNKFIRVADDSSTINAIGFSKSGSTATAWFPSGNVGIGTASPAYRLDVAGDLNISTGSVFRIGGTAISFFTGSGTTNYLTKFTGSTALGNSSIFDNGSSIGFYTASPAGVFQVAGTGNIFFGDTPSNTNYKFNVKGFSGNYISFWTPTLSGVNQNGIMSHSGAGLGAVTPLGYYASAHIFGGEVTGGGLVQVAGDVNISGTFRVNGTAIGTGGGGVSGSGSTNFVPMWSSSTSLTNSNIVSYPSSSLISLQAKQIDMQRNDGVMEAKFQSNATYPQGAILNMNMISTDAINNRTVPGSSGGLKFSSQGRVSFYGDSNSSALDGNYAVSIIAGTNANSFHTLISTITGNNAYINHIVGNNYTFLHIGNSGTNDAFIGATTTYNSNSNLVLGANRFGTGMYTTMIIKWNTISLPYIPTSSSGLSSGDVYRDGSGYLRIV